MTIVFYLSPLLLILTRGTLVEDCTSTPFWKLNMCDIECDQCGANGVCQLCVDSFNLIQSRCQLNSSLVYYNSYFTAAEIKSTQIEQKMFKAANQYLSMGNVLTFCQGNNYKFDMIGLFTQQTILTYNMNFDTPVTYIIIRMNFFTLYNNTKFQLVLNGQQVYQKLFTLSNLNNTYIQSSNLNTPNYINIPSLTGSSANVIINKIQTDPIPISIDLFNQNNKLNVQIAYSTNTTNTSKFWAFSDFTVLATKCQSCIPQKLSILTYNVAIAIGIISAALIVLILIMYACVKIQQKRRLNSHQQQEDSNNFTEEEQKQEQKEEQKYDDLKIRQTMKQQQNIIKKNKLS